MTTDWVSIAILSTVLIGLVNIIDSYVLTRRVPSLSVMILPVGLFVLIYSIVAAFLFPLPEGVGGQPLVVAIFSSVTRAFSLVIFLYTLKREEVSRVIPVASIFPIFVALMAVPLLGETLGFLQWMAIMAVVAGAIVISIKRQNGSGRWLSTSFFLLLISSVLMAVANTAAKYALDYVSFWNMYWLSSMALGLLFLVVSARSSVLQQIINLPRRGSTLAILGVAEIIVVVAAAFRFWSIENGPVSLVSAIFASRPLFVLALVFCITRFWPGLLEWQPGRGVMVQRIVATGLIVAGIAVIYLI